MLILRSATLRRYVANTSWMLLGRLTRLAVALFVQLYIARHLGPERYGLLNYALSFVGLLTATASLGLDGVILRDMVRSPEERDVILGSAFWLRIGGAAIHYGCLVAAATLAGVEPEALILILVIAASTVLDTSIILDAYFQSRVLARLPSIAQIVSVIASGLLRLALILADAPLVWFAVAYVIESLVNAAVLLALYVHSRLSPLAWRFSREVARRLLRDSWPLMLAGMAVMIYMRIDQVMIKSMLGSEAVGNYALAVQFSEAWYFIPIAVSSSLFPGIVEARLECRERYLTGLQDLYLLMVWMGVAVALPATFLADFAVGIVGGGLYESAAGILKIHIWSGVFVALGVASGKWFLVENLQIVNFYQTLAGASLNIVLNLFLIPAYGAGGAAIATVISYLTSAWLSMALFSRTAENFRLATSAFNPLLLYRRILHALS